jgi:hypothetical protein
MILVVAREQRQLSHELLVEFLVGHFQSLIIAQGREVHLHPFVVESLLNELLEEGEWNRDLLDCSLFNI